MKGQIRNIYPGGNTPKGFYPYYNYILSQRKAEKFFCIKGGPGSGKSTLMKRVAEHFLQQGDNVDLLWCSSDPESLDGVLLRDRATVLVDGTSPHIVDPQNPGAVDEIINLGEYWNEEGIRRQRNEIIKCSENIRRSFKNAYGYLACAEAQYIFTAQIWEDCISGQQMRESYYRMDRCLESAAAIKRAENKNIRDMAMGSRIRTGEVKKAFIGAITPAGLKMDIESVLAHAEKVIALRVPLGFRTEKLLSAASDRIVGAGMDVEEYYCPMRPQEGLEHIFCEEASIAVVTCNPFHDIDKIPPNKKILEINVSPEENMKEEYVPILTDLEEGIGSNISKALGMLKKAKEYHDELEGYYVPHMNFAEIEKLTDRIIAKIE